FFLPRLGNANPIDTILSRASSGLDSQAAKEKEEGYLKEFGMVRVDAAGGVLHDAAGKPVKTSLAAQFGSYLLMSFRGDLGTSILQYPKKVSEIIKTALPW